MLGDKGFVYESTTPSYRGFTRTVVVRTHVFITKKKNKKKKKERHNTKARDSKAKKKKQQVTFILGTVLFIQKIK